MQFRVNRDGDQVDVTATSTKRKFSFELQRTQADKAPCRARLLPLPVAGVRDDYHPPGDTFAAVLAAKGPDHHPLVGSWTGQRPRGLIIELNVVSVSADGTVRGLYCDIWPDLLVAIDISPDIAGAINATATDSHLNFKYKRRKSDFTLDTPGTMTYAQQIRSNTGTKTLTLAMKRTDEPMCASRVIVPPPAT